MSAQAADRIEMALDRPKGGGALGLAGFGQAANLALLACVPVDAVVRLAQLRLGEKVAGPVAPRRRRMTAKQLACDRMQRIAAHPPEGTRPIAS